MHARAHFIMAPPFFRCPCKVCGQDIVGPRFACLHCPQRLECCLACSEDALKMATAAPQHNLSTHAFQIFFEDVAAVSSRSGPQGGDFGSGSSGSSSGSSDPTPRERVQRRLHGFLQAAEGVLLGPPEGTTPHPLETVGRSEADEAALHRPSERCNPS